MKPEEYKVLWTRYNWLEYAEDGTEIAKVFTSSIGSLLGYPTKADTTQTQLQVTDYSSSPSQYPELFSIVQDILEVKVLLSQALKDSMAKELGDLKLDMGTYINNLKHRGSVGLSMLSQYTQIPLVIDMFSGRIYQTHTTPYSLKALF